jgi:maleylpyruvate isomerase
MSTHEATAHDDPMTWLETIDEATAALMHTLEQLDDHNAHAPSGLPGWTRGHVVTHLARNADGLVNLLTWARTGVKTPMYPSRNQRNADIEAGSTRSAAVLRDDAGRSHLRLMAAARELPLESWSAPIVWGQHDSPGTAEVIPKLRQVEVEVHHVDLDLGYAPSHWPADFASRLLHVTASDQPRGDGQSFVLKVTDLGRDYNVGDAGPTISGRSESLLAWLIGRSDGSDLQVEPAGPLPQLGAWR